MKFRLLLATAATVALGATSAFAQSGYDWNGFYAGANAGVSWSDTDLDASATSGTGAIVLPPADAAAISQIGSSNSGDTGFAGGFQVGYNFQSGGLVLGIEGDVGIFDIGEERAKTFQSALLIAPPINFTIDQNAGTDLLITLRPRIGYASGPWMIYATGGLAWSKIDLDTSYSDTRATPITAHDSEHETKSGWTAGGGFAYAFSPNWSARGEWLYVDLGTTRRTFVAPDSFATFTSIAKVRGNILRLGIDYNF